MNDPKECIECGRALFGRADKKYCSDACRSAHNNKSVSTNTSYIRKINRRLAKNRSILEKLNPGGKTKTHKDQLIKAGFDFSYHTRTYVTKDNKTYYFCYEQGYLLLGNDFILLVRNDGDE
ncbi:MAG: hypothetical protein JXR10_10785 [Cyclobacteriaceae bacterium]